MKKVAFCFLIYDIINHEELWNAFFGGIDKEKYNIYIHYKTSTELKYFEKNKIKNCIETEYCSYTVSLAINYLMRTAYNDDVDNTKFILLSGACIPLKPFNYIYDKMTRDDYGYFTVCPQTQCFPNCNSLTSVIEKDKISKAFNWFILNRNLTKNICFGKDEFINKHYKNIYAAEEYFFYTAVKQMGLDDEIITTANTNILDSTTFANWKGDGYKYPSLNGVKTYVDISNEELIYLLDSNCLFGRKFNVNCYSIYDTIYVSWITHK
jgi:hypothetical protein